MPKSADILLYGSDARLLQTRLLILQAAGFAVSLVQSLKDAKQTLAGDAPKVLVLCHTLLPDERTTLLKLAHARPQVRTLLLEGVGHADLIGERDEVLPRYRGPKELVKAVTRLAALAEGDAA